MLPRSKMMVVLSGVFDMLLGGYFFLASIGFAPNIFNIPTDFLRWAGILLFLSGAGVAAYFSTRQ